MAFSLFRKKIPVAWVTETMIAVFDELPPPYRIHGDQLRAGLIAGMARRPASGPNYLGILFAENISTYEDPRQPYIALTGIRIFSRSEHDYVGLEIHLYTGVPIGIGSQIPLSPDDLDLDRIDLTELQITTPSGEFADELTAAEITGVNPSEVYEVWSGDTRLLHLRDLDDGDFVALLGTQMCIVEIAERHHRMVPLPRATALKPHLADLSAADIYAAADEQLSP